MDSGPGTNESTTCTGLIQTGAGRCFHLSGSEFAIFLKLSVSEVWLEVSKVQPLPRFDMSEVWT